MYTIHTVTIRSMYGERVGTRGGGSGARAALCGTPRSHCDSKRFRVWSFAVAAWRSALARRVLRDVLIPWASCPSIPHVKALCLLAACMHACDYERKSQIFVADSTFFCSQRDCRPILLFFFFPLWTFFDVVLHAFRRCWLFRFLFFRFVVGSRR
jgi:hypothetical protein